MTHCPPIGTWRAWLDEETSIVGPDEHLAACRGCAETVADLRADAAFTAGRMARLGETRTLPPATVHPLPSRRALRGHRSTWLKSLVAAAAALVLVFTPFGQDAAEAFLAAFRVERFDLVRATALEAFQTAETLAALGSIDDGAAVPIPSTASIEEASAQTGLDVSDLAGLSDGAVLVVPESSVTWTLDGERVAAHLAEQGSSIPVPSELDGTVVTIRRAPAVVAAVGAIDDPELIVAVSGPVTANTMDGMGLGDLRAFLLELPGIPEGVTNQLGAIEDWQTTLPIPVPVDHGSASIERMGGVEVVTFEVDALGTGLMWLDGEQIQAVMAPSEARAREAFEQLSG